ncbi:MAG: hypothetical protein ACYC5X_00895 [Syntrophales bacterium]
MIFYLAVIATVLNQIAFKGSKVLKFIQVLVPVIVGTLGSAFGVGPAFWMDALMLASGAFIMRADARSRVRVNEVQPD